jgi:phosphate starvation-inducible PhoH-like protein
LNTHLYKQKLKLLPYNPEKIRVLCGVCNEHLTLIEQHHHVQIRMRDYGFSVHGQTDHVKNACAVLQHLYTNTSTEQTLNIEQIHSLLSQTEQTKNFHSQQIGLADRQITLQNQKQIDYIKTINEKTITFAYGPAGTGKTFLAVAAAVEALNKQEIQKIILVRPAVDAGESIGFLPGDIQEKFNPYLQPFYDSLHSLMPNEKTKRLIAEHTIEVAPLAFMRGRTLANAFIILDEGQNTTIEQMKMILTRIGHHSKLCITGDPSQVDLPKNKLSGLIHAQKILQKINEIGHVTFDQTHVVRHHLIEKILLAYEKKPSTDK